MYVHIIHGKRFHSSNLIATLRLCYIVLWVSGRRASITVAIIDYLPTSINGRKIICLPEERSFARELVPFPPNKSPPGVGRCLSAPLVFTRALLFLPRMRGPGKKLHNYPGVRLPIICFRAFGVETRKKDRFDKASFFKRCHLLCTHVSCP